MANPNLSTHLPIVPVATVSGNQEGMFNYLEGASQTHVQGAPVKLSSGASIVSASAFTSAAPILGFSAYPGHNLASAGLGASPLYGSIGFPGGAPTFGSVQNQPSAVNLLHGSPFVDGLMPVYLALPDTIFECQVDASAGGTFAATTSLLGQFSILKTDGNNFWWLDIAAGVVSATQGTNTVVIVGLNPQDLVAGSVTTQVNNGRVRFKVVPLASAVSGT